MQIPFFIILGFSINSDELYLFLIFFFVIHEASNRATSFCKVKSQHKLHCAQTAASFSTLSHSCKGTKQKKKRIKRGGEKKQKKKIHSEEHLQEKKLVMLASYGAGRWGHSRSTWR